MALKYDTFMHHEHQLEGAPVVVTLVYQAFCDPCRSTKHYVEEFARKHGFPLIRIDGAFSWDVEMAGQLTPFVQVNKLGQKPSPPLVGAHTAQRICDYLIEYGAIAPTLA